MEAFGAVVNICSFIDLSAKLIVKLNKYIFEVKTADDTSKRFAKELRRMVEVLKAFPQRLWRDRLTVVHIALAWIFTYDAVDNDGLFPRRKPAVLPSEPTGCLAWTRRHKNKREQSNHESYYSFEQE